MKNTSLDQINKMIESSNKRMDLLMKFINEESYTYETIKMAQKESEIQARLLDMALEMEQGKAPIKISPKDKAMLKGVAGELAKRKRSRSKPGKK
jgi:hypothetical protein